jgi:hypothetical protein
VKSRSVISVGADVAGAGEGVGSAGAGIMTASAEVGKAFPKYVYVAELVEIKPEKEASVSRTSSISWQEMSIISDQIKAILIRSLRRTTGTHKRKTGTHKVDIILAQMLRK